MTRQIITFQKVSRIAVALTADKPLTKEVLEYWANEGYMGASPLDANVIDPALISHNDKGRWVAIGTHEPKPAAPRPRGRPRRARP